MEESVDRMLKRKRLHSSKRAFAFVSILVVISILSVLTLAITTRIRTEFTSTTRENRMVRASYAARAGLQNALVQLSGNDEWQPSSPFTGTLQHDPSLSFEVEVLNNFSGSTDQIAPSGVTVPSRRVWLRSTGIVDGERVELGSGQAESLPVRPPVIFNHNIHERGSYIQFTGNVADTYEPLPSLNPEHFRDDDPPNLSDGDRNASVRTGDYFSINLGLVDGDITAPSLSDISADPSRYSGELIADPVQTPPLVFTRPASLPEPTTVAVPGAGNVLAPGSYTELNIVPGERVEFQNGDYYFKILTIGDGGSLELTSDVSKDEPCVIFIAEQMNVGIDAKVNLEHSNFKLHPDLLQIYGTDEDPEGKTRVTFDQGSLSCLVLAGARIYAVMREDSEIFGSFIVESLVEGPNSKFHYPHDVLRNQELDTRNEWVLFNERRE